MVLRFPELAPKPILSSFDHAPGRRAEGRDVVVLLCRGREYFPAQSQVQSEIAGDLVIVLSEQTDGARLLIPVRRIGQRTLRGCGPAEKNIGQSVAGRRIG